LTQRSHTQPSLSCRTPRRNTESPSTRHSCKSTGGRIAREREKADYAFAARRKIIERIGLTQVRNYRLNLLSQEERSFQEQLDQKAHALPELTTLIVIRVVSSECEVRRA